jgi:hypothetical protein
MSSSNDTATATAPVDVPPGVNTSPTPTSGIVRIGRGLREGELGFDRQLVVGDEGSGRVIVFVAGDQQTLEAAQLRIQGVIDACAQIKQIASGLRNAVAQLGLGKAAARDLLAAEGMSIEGGGVVHVKG